MHINTDVLIVQNSNIISSNRGKQNEVGKNGADWQAGLSGCLFYCSSDGTKWSTDGKANILNVRSPILPHRYLAYPDFCPRLAPSIPSDFFPRFAPPMHRDCLFHFAPSIHPDFSPRFASPPHFTPVSLSILSIFECLPSSDSIWSTVWFSNYP